MTKVTGSPAAFDVQFLGKGYDITLMAEFEIRKHRRTGSALNQRAYERTLYPPALTASMDSGPYRVFSCVVDSVPRLRSICEPSISRNVLCR